MRVRLRDEGAASACALSSIDGASEVCCGAAGDWVPSNVGMSTMANGAVNGSAVSTNKRPAINFRSMAWSAHLFAARAAPDADLSEKHPTGDLHLDADVRTPSSTRQE